MGFPDGLGVTRAVFDFGALDSAVPRGANVAEAHLSLWNTGGLMAVRTGYSLYGLTRSFTGTQRRGTARRAASPGPNQGATSRTLPVWD